ncbi:hypothetical protein [Leisingera daeponensis]|uniref:hypothetical protein n=1 Tax=Leisingera daeponensis TaxID=405746 RepID=UPI001C9729AE|nr:hypothetical protein [Leisingera daeponensis]MBY6059183.1 hypothetical protein [Leisingera daeponensis]
MAPGTVFGFHGPSRRGVRLKDEDFEYFSRLMAWHYPELLQAWFLQTGRYGISRVYKIKGSEIIRIGVPACRSA